MRGVCFRCVRRGRSGVGSEPTRPAALVVWRAAGTPLAEPPAALYPSAPPSRRETSAHLALFPLPGAGKHAGSRLGRMCPESEALFGEQRRDSRAGPGPRMTAADGDSSLGQGCVHLVPHATTRRGPREEGMGWFSRGLNEPSLPDRRCHYHEKSRSPSPICGKSRKAACDAGRSGVAPNVTRPAAFRVRAAVLGSA